MRISVPLWGINTNVSKRRCSQTDRLFAENDEAFNAVISDLLMADEGINCMIGNAKISINLLIATWPGKRMKQSFPYGATLKKIKELQERTTEEAWLRNI